MLIDDILQCFVNKLRTLRIFKVPHGTTPRRCCVVFDFVAGSHFPVVSPGVLQQVSRWENRSLETAPFAQCFRVLHRVLHLLQDFSKNDLIEIIWASYSVKYIKMCLRHPVGASARVWYHCGCQLYLLCVLSCMSSRVFVVQNGPYKIKGL